MDNLFRDEWIREFRDLVSKANTAPYLYGDERYVKIPLATAEAVLEILEAQQ
jgi:hypothetical protein